MSFTIPRPGYYRQHGGGKAEVVGQSHDRRWVGFAGDACWWNTEGCMFSGANRPGDIVAEWTDIPEPPAGFVVMPRDYVAKDGDRAQDKEHSDVWYHLSQHVGMSALDMDKRFSHDAPHYIASPIPAPPKIDPGEGWLLLEDDEPPQDGDQCKLRDSTGGWYLATNWKMQRPEQSEDCVYRRRIPAPFRISDHGLGLYECRSGQQEPIEGKSFTGNAEHPWRGAGRDGDYKLYRDDGQRCSGKESPDDLVRYIGPLPAPETTPKFKVGDRVRTIDGYGNERQCTVMAVPGVAQSDYLVFGDGGWSAWRSPSALEAENKAPETWTPTCELQLQQRWTCGERSEWRPIPVEATT